jgi:hypothetical protein
MKTILNPISINNMDIPTSTPLVIAFDPGITTGYSMTTEHMDFYLTGQTDGDSIARDFELLISRLSMWSRLESLVIIEDYELTPRPQSFKEGRFTLKLIGALNYLALSYGFKVKLPKPAEREIATYKYMQKMGFWSPGQRHANDAAKHLVTHLIKAGKLRSTLSA